ncbi:uncharacterized protein LOC105840995 isoform X2 [Monomorium pharaonis]|uniref:uncharacterized protein LOC105840995 isoform X2 n=1 Tax=Monomorium pharaonis TaxID=307658 RepID=UPI0017461EE2|nr:uncharacterized protein LOC105840995 isoform X2 [Monomorium pharaonis]
MSGFGFLQSIILLINILGLAGSTLNWSWLKWDRQLKKILNFSVSQSDELVVQDIDWLKTILSWIEAARLIISRVSLLAYVANIYTIFTQSRQNLLVLWMILSFLKDFVLEVVVIVITFLLWRKGSVPTSRLVEFITEKSIWLVIFICKCYPTLKWYMQLRKVAKFRRFTMIARRSIASIADVPGRVGRSLDDECLDIAIIRRGKHASLLNLNGYFVDLSSRTNAKSLTTLVTDDTSDANDYNSDVNDDLSVAEKSMRMLKVTAEDVMDARSRILERSYWEEQDAGTSEVMEERAAQFPFLPEEDKGKVLRNKLAKGDVEKTVAHVLRKEFNRKEQILTAVRDNVSLVKSENVNRALRKEDIIGNSTVKKQTEEEKDEEKGDDEIVLVNGKEEILTGDQENVSLVKSENVDHALRKEDIIGNFTAKKQTEEERGEEKGDDEIVLVNGKEEQILTGDQENVSLVKSENVISNKVESGAKSTESRNVYAASKKKKKEKGEGVAKTVQCPSFQSEKEAKPCASLVRKLEAKLYRISVNQQENTRLERVDWRKHPSCQIDAPLVPTGPEESEKERNYKNSKISCACHRALRNGSKNGKNVEYNVNEREFKSFSPIVNMQRGRIDRSAYGYSEAYRLKKQIEKCEESHKRQSWGSKSLAQAARPSGYEGIVVDAPDKLSTENCRGNVQTEETCDETATGTTTMMTCDSSSKQRRWKPEQMRNRRSAELRTVYNMASFGEENYAEAREIRTKALDTSDNFMLANKRETRARKRHDLPPASRKLSSERREAIELRALRAYNELTLSEDKRELGARRGRDSSLIHGAPTKESEETKVVKTCNNPSPPEDKTVTVRAGGRNLSPSFQRSVGERRASRVRHRLARSGSERELEIRRKRDSLTSETPSEREEPVGAPTGVSNRLSIAGSCMDTAIPARRNANHDSNRYARQAPLNLREITRNIERVAHPRGVILANKNLHGQFPGDGRLREGQQRDIVDDNTVGAMHSAFFFKPEIVTRVFWRAHNPTGTTEGFFPSFPILRQEDLDAEFVCRMDNEMITHNRDELFEQKVENDQDDLGDSTLPVANDNRGEQGHNLCVIFVDREQVPSESQVATESSAAIGLQGDTRLNIENSRRINVLIFDENHNRVDNAIDDNLPVRLIADVGNYDVELSERSIRDVALPIEDAGNVNVHNSPPFQEFNAVNQTDTVKLDRENNNESEIISSRRNANADGTIHGTEQVKLITLNSSDNCAANVNDMSYVGSLEKLNNSRGEKYLSAIDIHSENEIYEINLSHESIDNDITTQLSDSNNNKQFDTLNNKAEKSMSNHVLRNSLKSSLPGPSSFIEDNNCHELKSCNEQLQKLTQLSNSVATLNDQREASVSNLETTLQDDARSKIDAYKKANEFLAEKIFKMHSDDKLQRDDSFCFMYDRSDDSGTPVSLEDGSLMEEFPNDPLPPVNTF